MEATLGFVDAPLVDRGLALRFRTTAPGDAIPLSFAIVRPISSSDAGGLPDGRYYPHPQPSIVHLGPGVGEEFTGQIRVRPRSYNTRWLETGYPASSWSLEADAWIEDGEVQPWFNPAGFAELGTPLRASTLTVGPAGAAPLIYV